MLAVAVACGSDAPDDGRCTETLAFTVTPGINPTFAWAPSCTIAQLRVIRNSNDAEVWSFVAGSNSVSSPVAYGQVPIGATETHANEVLLFDEEYTVRVAVLDPDEGLLLVAGSAAFTPTN
jgi:hypothetical protein